MVPQIASADLDAPRGAVMRMTGDAERALAPNLAQDVGGALIGAHVALYVERDDVRVLLAADAVLRHLDTGHDEHAVLLPRPLALLVNVVEISLEVLLAHTERPPTPRPQQTRTRLTL